MFGKKEPTNELDQRAAELAQRPQALASDASERRRLESAKSQATAARERAHADLAGIINDAMRFATTPEVELQAAKTALVSTTQAMTQAAAKLAAHEREHGDLGAIAEELGRDENLLEQARVQAAHRAIVERKLQAALEVEALESEEHRLVREAYRKWPDGAALVPCTFVAGVFTAAETTLGPDAPKSIFRHDVLRSIAVAHPEVLAAVLPSEEAAAILAAIEADRAKSVIRFANPAIGWSIAGTWHVGGIAAEELLNYLRGPLRRKAHG